MIKKTVEVVEKMVVTQYRVLGVLILETKVDVWLAQNVPL